IQLRLGGVGDRVLSQREGELLARHRRNSSRCGIYSGQADVRSDASRAGSAGRPAGGERGRGRPKGAGGGRPVSDGSDGSGPPLSPISSSRARDSLEPLKNKQGAIGERERSLPSLPTLTPLTAVPIAGWVAASTSRRSWSMGNILTFLLFAQFARGLDRLCRREICLGVDHLPFAVEPPHPILGVGISYRTIAAALEPVRERTAVLAHQPFRGCARCRRDQLLDREHIWIAELIDHIR